MDHTVTPGKNGRDDASNSSQTPHHDAEQAETTWFRMGSTGRTDQQVQDWCKTGVPVINQAGSAVA